MKLSLVIMVVSLVLLSTMRNGIADSPNQGNQSTAKAQTKNSPSAPVSFGDKKAAPEPSGNASDGVTYNYYGDFNYRPNDSGGFPWAAIGQGATVVATVLMAIFTIALFRSSVWQWQAITDQGKIALAQLRLETRPNIEMYADTLFDDVGTHTMCAYFTLINIGDRDAKIEDQTFVLWTLQAPLQYPVLVPFDDESPKPLPETFQSHDRRFSQVTHRKLSVTEFVGSGKSTWQSYLDGDFVACLAGRIRYWDTETNQLHETHFCCSWDRGASQFLVPPKMPPSFNCST